eukprot:gene21388-28339_t
MDPDAAPETSTDSKKRGNGSGGAGQSQSSKKRKKECKEPLTASALREATKLPLTASALREAAKLVASNASSLAAVQELTSKIGTSHPMYDVQQGQENEWMAIVSLSSSLGTFKASGTGFGARKAKTPLAPAADIEGDTVMSDEGGVATGNQTVPGNSYGHAVYQTLDNKLPSQAGKSAPTVFTVRASVSTPAGTIYEEGRGKRLKLAEQDCARWLIVRLGGVLVTSGGDPILATSTVGGLSPPFVSAPVAHSLPAAPHGTTSSTTSAGPDDDLSFDTTNYKGLIMERTQQYNKALKASQPAHEGAWGLPKYETSDNGGISQNRLYTSHIRLTGPKDALLHGWGTDTKIKRAEKIAAKAIYLQLADLNPAPSTATAPTPGGTASTAGSTGSVAAADLATLDPAKAFNRVHNLIEQQGWTSHWDLVRIPQPGQEPWHQAHLYVNGRLLAGGLGASAKEAKQEAASLAIKGMVVGDPNQFRNQFGGPVAGDAFSPERAEEVCLVEFQRMVEAALLSGSMQSKPKATMVSGFLIQVGPRKEPSLVSLVSGFLIQDGPRKEPTLVSLACGAGIYTGSWGDLAKSKGAIINDSHGEVLARRGLLRYLYSQAEQAVQLGSKPATASSPPPIFELVDRPAGADIPSSGQLAPTGKRLRLRPGVRFHMYCSGLPCGDASCRKSISILSSPPAGKGQGTTLGSTPTVGKTTAGPSAAAGDNTVTAGEARKMSCSDKLASWNALGLQGALLGSMLLEPIHLSSVTIGLACQGGEAVSTIGSGGMKRHERELILEAPYQVSHPSLFRSLLLETAPGKLVPPLQRPTLKDGMNSQNECLNWNLADGMYEVTLATTGALPKSRGQYGSRLSKVQLCQRRLALAGTFPIQGGPNEPQDAMSTDVGERPSHEVGLEGVDTYRGLKDAQIGYMDAKGLLRSHFEQGHHNVKGACQQWLRRQMLAPGMESFPTTTTSMRSG